MIFCETCFRDSSCLANFRLRDELLRGTLLQLHTGARSVVTPIFGPILNFDSIMANHLSMLRANIL